MFSTWRCATAERKVGSAFCRRAISSAKAGARSHNSNSAKSCNSVASWMTAAS